MCDGNKFHLYMYLCDLCLAFSICSVHMALEQTGQASLKLQKHQGQKKIDGEQIFHCIAGGPYMTDCFVFSPRTETRVS